jgi:hypothetical protein
MTLGRKKRGRIDGDPPLSEHSRGKDRSQRKSARDGSTWTPTESRKRDALMRQFLQRDGTQGNSEAYRNAGCWDARGRLKP